MTGYIVDFAARFTIHTNSLSKLLHYTWKVLSLKVVHLPIACQSERSLSYFHLDRIGTLFAIDQSNSHTQLAAVSSYKPASGGKASTDGSKKIQVFVRK